ncbi:MAG: RHS repeat domain-containing protein, partial [Limisphaerales bacterium]
MSYSLPPGVTDPNEGDICVILGFATNAIWFEYTGSGYESMFNTQCTLSLSDGMFYFTDAVGNTSVFYDFSGQYPGRLYQFIDPYGHVTTPVYDGQGRVTQYVRSDGGSNSDGFLYTYYTSGDNAGKLQYVTRQTNSTNVQQSVYSYYSTGDSNGNLGDLESEVIQEWNGTAWVTTATNYYRYWLSDSTPGVIHGLKYVVGAEAYARMVAAGLTPETATDTQVAGYADCYYEYDSNRRVTKEVVEAGNRTYEFTYTPSSFGNDYNEWQTKTVESLPNGGRNIVYNNYSGMPMLEVYVSPLGNSWYTYYQYDDNANVVLRAESSAVTSFDDTQADLGVVLNNTGLIYTYDFYTSTGGGGVAGYLQYENVQQGANGTPVILREYQYTSQTVGGVTIYRRSKVVCYPSATDQTLSINCTVYSYTWYPGTFQIQQQTTTWPEVDTTQNGSGSTNSREQYFDEYGQLIWTRDERGFLTNYTWDLATGGLLERIDDVNTDLVPAPAGTGWTTPPGGGLHLITDYEVDAQGRITQELGPSHTVDIGGAATPIRRARWWVYLDAEQMVYQGAGYATGTDTYTYTLINPVRVTQLDNAGRVVDDIMATRASTSGPLSPSDTFEQSSYVRWKVYNYSNAGLLISEQEYYDIPASGSGSEGVNYNQTDYAYDSMDKLQRNETPGGTITWTIYDQRERMSAIWVGTNDEGATSSNPAGSGPPNNMVQLALYQYDDGETGQNDNLTQQNLYDGSDTRITSYVYDFRNRRTSLEGELDTYFTYTYDNLNRLTETDQWDGEGGALVVRTQINYDNNGRIYQRLAYSVSGGVAGNSLVEKFWYDPAGNLIKYVPLGSRVFQKKQYDGVNRPTVGYLCYSLS